MKTKPRDSGTLREPGLSSLFHRVSPGKWIGLLLIVRALHLATGCETSPSGPCDESCSGRTCRADEYCEDNTCHQSLGSPVYEAGPASICDPAAPEDPSRPPLCTPDEEELFCFYGQSLPLGATCREPEENFFCCSFDGGVSDASDLDAGEDDASDDAE